MKQTKFKIISSNCLPKKLLTELENFRKKSFAEKRKVSAILFDSKYNIIEYGLNYHNFNNGICEDSNKETFDTVIHAEQDAIFKMFKNKKTANNILVSYSPCIECSKQIVLSGINNVFIVEEHPSNFRTPQYNPCSFSPIEYLLYSGINVFIYNKELEKFDKICIESKKAVIYHSKDLDGFMSRYLTENYIDNDKDYEYIGYNYESDATWMHEKYDELIFIDVTPPLSFIKENFNTNIVIIDHHINNIESIIECVKNRKVTKYINHTLNNKVTFQDFNEISRFNYQNVIIFYSNDKTKSACEILFDAFIYDYNELITEFVYYISKHDTWSFNNLECKEELLSIIEALKLFNYENFKKLLNQLTIDNRLEFKEELIQKGKITRDIVKSQINNRLDHNKLVYENLHNVTLIVSDINPTYELESILRDKYDCSILYIGYSVNIDKSYISYSVRYYPKDKNNGGLALKIAKTFKGGGHPNAAGFKMKLSEGLNLISTKFESMLTLL